MRHRESSRESERRRAPRAPRRTRFHRAATTASPAAASLAIQAFRETLLGYVEQPLGCPCCLPSIPPGPPRVRVCELLSLFTHNATHTKRRTGANSGKTAVSIEKAVRWKGSECIVSDQLPNRNVIAVFLVIFWLLPYGVPPSTSSCARTRLSGWRRT